MKYTIVKIFIGLLFLSQGLYAHPSWSIVVDKHRNIYFADLAHNGNGTIWKLTKDGKLTALLKDTHSHKVMLDKEGNLLAEYVGKGDREGFLIRIYPDGRTETLIRTEDGSKFSVNCDVALSGNVYFNYQKYIWKRDPAGKIVKHSNHRLEAAQSLYVDEEENIYVPDKGVDNGILLKIDKSGKAEIMARDLISRLDRPRDFHNDVLLGLTKGCDGYMYVAELAGQRIIKITENGQTQTFYRSEGDWFPTGVDFFAGDAYILEYKNKNGNNGPRITRVDESGNKSILFDYDAYSENRPDTRKERNNSIEAIWLYILGGLGSILLIVAIRKLIYNNKLKFNT
ncbi:hypothetical protein GWK08_16335 [Leptobacterium flavescens]|uniref:DUF5050 domain-containing protein n=1 Tax=Leptobacterium flavescens TaxID=472055 RepID=A0A6P0UPD3_9FLAO|nr:hypothetical protein [Leptobacterium flavescens]NER15025.1 hypothetical protein [Leptobacterium flavescens]